MVSGGFVTRLSMTRDAADADGLAPVVAEDELVEVGLQVLRLHRAGMGAEQPALQQRHCPMAALHDVLLAPLGLVCTTASCALAEARCVVACVPVGDDGGLGIDLAVREALRRLGVIVVGGFLVFSSTVPDVRLVWCPHAAHSNVVPSRIVQTRVDSQRAQAGSPPHRTMTQ
jgi:hypothetical protein